MHCHITPPSSHALPYNPTLCHALPYNPTLFVMHCHITPSSCHALPYNSTILTCTAICWILGPGILLKTFVSYTGKWSDSLIVDLFIMKDSLGLGRYIVILWCIPIYPPNQTESCLAWQRHRMMPMFLFCWCITVNTDNFTFPTHSLVECCQAQYHLLLLQ